MPSEAGFVTGLVLAAGGSKRLGVAKQLLAFRGATLLDATLDMARRCGFDQLLVTVGGRATDVRAGVDLGGAQVVENPAFGEGCSTSIRAALDRIDPGSDGIVLLLGDQPGVQPEAVRSLVASVRRSGSPIGICRYRDGRGHPFWFARELFGELQGLHGDKAIWKLLESGRFSVCEVAVDGDVPIDVDTWADYEALLAAEG